jgi:hypothetical protein
MILNITNAKYIDDYKIFLTFNTGDSHIVDLSDIIFNETRKIFQPLKEPTYFQNFKLWLNTIVWENEADFAPEFLLELAKKQQKGIN